MGSLDPRRCATPEAVAKLTQGTACGRMMGTERKRSDYEGEWSAGHSACGWLERASFRTGWLSGVEAGTARSVLARRNAAMTDGVRLERQARSRGVAGAPAEWGAPHAVGAGGKTFPPSQSWDSRVWNPAYIAMFRDLDVVKAFSIERASADFTESGAPIANSNSHRALNCGVLFSKTTTAASTPAFKVIS